MLNHILVSFCLLLISGNHAYAGGADGARVTAVIRLRRFLRQR
jgi:hypothetical protein